MKKRVLSMFMVLALCLTLLPAPVRAAEDTPESGAIVQQEQQEEISPAVSEQAGTNEEENGSEGDPQNTGTPDAGGAEDSKADAPESGEDENAGNNADAAVSAVQTMIDALPTVSELDGMTAGELDAAYNDIQAAYDAYEALNAEQQAQINGADFEALLGWFNSQTAPLADAQSGVHTHCVCGKDSSTTVNGHTHNTGTTWTAPDALPSTAGSYYLTQSVTADWTVPTGEVNLCLNGQTINGKITVGGGATLTLTDCSGNGKVQGEVTVNGGKFELYSGTITGGVQVGMKGGTYQTGSSFTMYGGAITGNEDYGGVFLVGTTNHIDPPSFTMHGGTISDNTAGASDGGGGGVYVGEKCSFTMDGGTITGNTATAGNGGGIYIHFNAGNVSISNATITGNKASATGDTRYGHGGGIYSERGVTVKNVTITGNNSTFEGGGIYGKGAITLTDATVTDNNQYDVYYDGTESTNPKLTVSGSVKAGYYANYDWKLPILVSGALSEDSVIRVGVREGINPGAIAEPASGVTLSAENFKADAADSVTSLGNDGKVYLVPCTHEMDDTGYTCKKCKTQFDARVGDSAYYKTLTDAFNAARGSTVTLLRNVTLTGNCSSENYSATLDLNGKTVSTENKYIHVGGGNKSNTLTVKDSSKGGGTQALNVKFSVGSNGTLAVDDSYTGEISRVELQAGGALERFGGKIGELVLSNAAYGSTSTGYGLKLWKGNPNACTIGKITDNTKSKSLTVNDLLGTDYAKCELYGEKDSVWSIVPKTEKISELTGYTAYKVQFTECVHQCADDSNPVCSVCHKDLYTKITAKAADGTTKTAYFTKDSALENGYVEAIQTLNGWSNEGCTEPTLTLLRDMPYGTSITLTGTLTLESGTHTAKNVTVAENANVTFASGSYKGATINGTATVEAGVTFTDASVTVNGTLNAKGGTFTGNVKFNGSSIANISGGSFNNEKKYGGVEFDYNVTGTISGGTFVFADFYTTKVKLSGGTFTMIKTNGDRKLADLLAEGAAYYGASDNQAVTNDRLNTLENVKVVSHTHNGGTDGNGTCSICGKQMAASLTVGGKTSWYAAFATAIEAANAADGEKTITLYQDVNGYADGHSTTYELTHGPVTLATGGKSVTRANLTAKGISLTVTGSNGGFNVTVEGKDAELTVNDKDTKLAIVTAQNGGKLSLSNGTFSRVAVKDDGSSASLSGGSYGEITSDAGYVKPYALLAKGYAYKKTRDNKWLPNANSISEKVTVEKAPFAVEKIYPNSDTNYTGNSAFATDGNITLTAVIAPETEGDTYYYWWELFNESENDWTTSFKKVNTATHTGEKSKTLTISGLPVDKSYQYHIFVQCSNGYNCDSEPFTVTRHQHSWTYTSSGATITASCTDTTCTSPNGGSVTIAAPAELTYNGSGKPATVTASSDWQGPAASGITISYIKTGKYGPENLENDALPTNAGTYTASITVGEDNKAATASVKYTIQKANPVVTEWPTLSAPVYVNSEATLTGGSGEGTFDFKAGAAKSWDSAGSKTTAVVFTPTYTNNYNELTQDYTVTVVKRTVKSCNTPAGIMDKPYGTAQEELGLPGTVTITTEDGKTFEIPVAWNDYDPNTLEEQTLTGTLDLTSIAGEVEQPSTPVTAQIKVKLTQKHFSGISPEAYDGVYDGKAHGITLTGVPSGATVKYGTSVNSCTQDSLTYTNFTNGPKSVFYKVSQFGYADASGSAWVNIAKRPLTVSNITENKTYVYASGSDDKAIGVDIAGKLPPDRGTTIYTVAKKDQEQLLSEVTVDTVGNLTYKVNQVDSSKVGKTAIITVTASMENYENVEYTLTINITDKKTVEIKRGNTVSVDGSNALTYGEKVSKLTLGNTVFVETGTDDMIEGILSWSNPDEIPAAGTTQAGWVFRPADSRHYAELTGTAAITVAKATPVIAEKPTAGALTYGQELSDSTLTGGKAVYQTADGTEITGAFAWKNSSIKPTAADSQKTEYDVTFTPSDKDNYNAVDTKLTLTVNKAALAALSGESRSYIYAEGSNDKAETMDVAGKLPADRGNTTFTLAAEDADGLLSDLKVDTAGKLSYKVKQLTADKAGKSAAITVTASMENYEDAVYTMTIRITDKKLVTLKSGNKVSVNGSNALTYGDKLSKLKFIDVTFVDADTNTEVKGTLEWAEPDFMPTAGTTQAGWVFKPADSKHYEELTGTAAITVARATPAVVTVPTVAEREYNPAVALADSDMTGGSVTGADGNELAGTWSFTGTIIIPTVNNKGYQAVFTPDDTNNYSTVTRTITVKVTKATPVIAEKPTAGALTYGQELSDSTLTGGKAVYQTADGTEITGAFAWKNSSIKPTAADSQKTEYDVTFTPSDKDNYNAVDTKLTLTVNKAALAALSGESRSYIYAEGSNDKAETMDVAGKLPADRGNTTFTLAAEDADGLLSDLKVDTAGKLSYKVKQLTADKAGKSAAITVTASMENYEDAVYTMTIRITDKKLVTLKSGNTVSVNGSNALTYGDRLSKLSFSSAIFVDADTDTKVEGTLEWADPDCMPTAGTTQAGWVFKPDDSKRYEQLTGTAAITVARATPAVVTVPTVAEREYNPAVALADSDMTGGSVTGADGNELAGTWSFTGTIIIPTVNNKGYQAVFTPDDTNNYSTVTRTITVKVTKATPVIAEKPTAGALTYGQELSDSTLTGGKAVYQTADGTEITGAFAWKNSSIKPTAADSQKTEYDVTFTPSDKDNYNAVDTKLTIIVNKAAQAPNMPQAAMAPAHSTKKVGDITLPDGWSWQEDDKDTALADGVAVTANAIYTGTDRGNYETESVSITITRSECEHKNTEIINKKDATCSVEGYTGDTYCKDCGETLATGTAIEKKPHTVGTSATCISKAVCSVCGEAFGEVDANNHVHTTVKNRKEATCTQTGYTGDTYCTDCNKLLGTGKELAALGHDYKATVTKQPTTTEEGIRTYTCTRCNSSYTESIAKLPEEQHTHNYTGSITKEATCTEAGVRTYTCSCGDSYTENIPATGHSYVSKVTKAATTTEEGIMTYTCSKCGHSYTQPIAKIKSDDSSKDNGSQNQKPQTGTDNGNQNQKPQPDTDNGKDNGTSIKPYIKDDSGKEGWDVIKPQLEEAKSGDTVTVAMNGTTVVPKDVIDSIKGKDTTLVLDMGNGLSWKIFGKDITDAAGDIDFGVTVGADAGKSIPVDVINNVTGERYSMNLTLAYDGEFGFTATLTVNMESKNAGLYANLFYYNEQTGELEFISAGQIDSDGNVELVFTHASDYTIVVDAKIMSDNGQADNKSDETIPASKTDDSTSKYAWNNTIIIIIGICIILIVFGAVFYVRKKSGSEEE